MESCIVSPAVEADGVGGNGRIEPSTVTGAEGGSALALSCAKVSRPEAVSQPSDAPSARTVAAASVVRVRMVLSPSKTFAPHGEAGAWMVPNKCRISWKRWKKEPICTVPVLTRFDVNPFSSEPFSSRSSEQIGAGRATGSSV